MTKREDPELEAIKEKLERVEAALVQSEKMASLGNLVAGVAHEINTPVGSIYSSSDLMMRALEDVGRVNQTACERIVSIIRSLKSFSRLEEPECRKASIHAESTAPSRSCTTSSRPASKWNATTASYRMSSAFPAHSVRCS